MKALITAFALLSFVAATTIPYAAQAETKTTTHHTIHKKSKKKHVAQNTKKPRKSHKSKTPTAKTSG
jgi:hypothetical protein